MGFHQRPAQARGRQRHRSKSEPARAGFAADFQPAMHAVASHAH